MEEKGGGLAWYQLLFENIEDVADPSAIDRIFDELWRSDSRPVHCELRYHQIPSMRLQTW